LFRPIFRFLQSYERALLVNVAPELSKVKEKETSREQSGPKQGKKDNKNRSQEKWAENVSVRMKL
jgi:hypothetical protein